MSLTFIALLFLAGCGPGKTARTANEPKLKVSKDENSYYYYFLSQLNESPEKVKEYGEYLDFAIKKDESSSFLWSQKAILEAQKANWQQAIAHAEHSLKIDPTNPDSLVLLGKLHAANQQPTEAIAYYKMALRFSEQREEIYNIMAREYLTLKQKNNAIRSLNRCVSEKSDAVTCLFYLATIYLQDEDFAQALHYFTLVRQFEPDNPKILQTIGEIHMQEKRPEEAVKIYENLKTLFPHDSAGRIRLGLIYYEMKEIDKAIEEFQVVLNRHPKSERMHYFLGLLHLEKGELDLAYKYLDKIKYESPFFKDVMSKLLFIWRERGDLKSAVNMLEDKFPKKEKNEDYYALAVSLYLFEENYAAAKPLADEGLLRFASSEQLLFQRAVIRERTGNWDGAKGDLKKIIALNPSADKAFNYLGYAILERGGTIEEAEPYVLRAHELKPNDGHITDSLAWLYYKKGDLPKALTLLFKAMEQEPNEPTILEHIADVYFGLKDKRKSRVYYERGLQLLEKKKDKTKLEKEQIQKIHDKLGKF